MRKWLALVWLAALTVCAEEKLVVLDDIPRYSGPFTVAPDGSRLFFAGEKFLVFDAAGQLVDQIGTPHHAAPRALFPLADGRFIAITSYANGRVAVLRPDGSEAQVLVTRGTDEKQPRADSTAWTSPCGGVVDRINQRIFVLDTTRAPRDDRRIPDPDWSRIAVYNFNGEYFGDINRYDAAAADAAANDSRRTWYRGIAVDPERQRVYVGAIARGEVLGFGYDGQSIGAVPATLTEERGAVAVFPDGRVAVTHEGQIAIYSPELKLLTKLSVPENLALTDLQTDAAGRLYASVTDRSVLFLRWPADLGQPLAIGPRYRRITVHFVSSAVTAGHPFVCRVRLAGRPEPSEQAVWQVLARPADGRDLVWQSWPTVYQDGTLVTTPPPEAGGLYEVAVRFGDGPLDWANRDRDLHVQRTLAVVPAGASRSVTVIPASGRAAYRSGEAIPFHVIRRAAEIADEVEVEVALQGVPNPEAILTSARLTVRNNAAWEVPSELTRRLVPGPYQLVPRATGHASYPFIFTIAAADRDSPLQRILYHEFGGHALEKLHDRAENAERLAFLREWTDAVLRLGFTRETWRDHTLPDEWHREAAPADITAFGHAPPEHYRAPAGNWLMHAYLDEATARGLEVDLQLIHHCHAVRPSPESLRELNLTLQRQAQAYGRSPAFYGFNYNDEIFPNSPHGGLQQSDKDFYAQLQAGPFKDRPAGELNQYILEVMYESFNAAVRAALPRVKTTATPMWQYPAVEGSYPPAIYRGMDESYSHYLSEGYAVPWNPAHSVDILRRPGLPVMGVFDNLYDSTDASERYLKNVLQVVGRGVQGVGVQHTAPFADINGATAYALANDLARMYGPIFAECPPQPEGAILYSRTQDYTEQRNLFGTPHWERVLELYAAGLMGGVPCQIVYEEDVAARWLLTTGAGDPPQTKPSPRVPFLFLVGQQAELPASVREGIAAFQRAGGRVYFDADSAPVAGGHLLPLKTHRLKSVWHDGYAADSLHPMLQPILESQAAAFRAAVGAARRFPVDTSDPWVSKNVFDGGAVQYVLLATETSPYPWSAAEVWFLGDMYNKGRNAWLPKSIAVTAPSAAVIYDVFERTRITPDSLGKTSRWQADLTTFPGRLYALAPKELTAPQLTATVGSDTIEYTVKLNLPARVPLRIRLAVGETLAAELYRASDAQGRLAGRLPRPFAAAAWVLEVTELLGGKTSAANVATPGGDALPRLVARGTVDIRREAQLRALLQTNVLTLVTADANIVSPDQQAALRTALQKHGIALRIGPVASATPSDGVYLAAGYPGALGEFLAQASGGGLLDFPLTQNVPGPGRGLVTALFAPRGFGENAVALVGGDAAGLANTITEFVRWLSRTNEVARSDAATPSSRVPRPVVRRGTASGVARIPRLSDRVGVRLTGVTPAVDGKHLLVTADGYLNNLLLIEEVGGQPRVRRVARVGEAYTIGSPYLSADGARFGATGRSRQRYGQAFHLIETASGTAEMFAAFGDMGRHRHRFGVAVDGDTVLAPGTFGVVCWRRMRDTWKEVWALDYWREFSKLDWPVSNSAERIPQFHAVIPTGADYGLILFGELTQNGWITPENHGTVWLAAVNLADGQVRWRFEVPLPKTLLFPTLHTSPDGMRTLVEVQMGSWGREAFRFFSVVEGRAVGVWDLKTAPTSVALSDSTGWIATSTRDRLLAVRKADGRLVFNQLWPTQPASLAFAADGHRLYVSDDAGRLSCLDAAGRVLWRIDLGCVAQLAARGERVYAAGWDGRLRSVTSTGQVEWILDCTPALRVADPMAALAAATRMASGTLISVVRPPTTSSQVPAGPNRLTTGEATLTVGGTTGWMSNGKVEIQAEELTNGRTDDVDRPWLNLDELFWNSVAGRQVFAEIRFAQPTDVEALTVYENPRFPDSWPTESRVQVWNEANQSWDTAAVGLFLTGPVNTYPLALKAVTKLRYVPWNSYYRNFYTSEIEVR